jgi:Domain of unknown function (DUF4143)
VLRVTNRLWRLVKAPKRYLTDASLMGAALRVDERAVMRDGDLIGRVLDTFVAAQLRPELAASARWSRLFHVREKNGRHEIDLRRRLLLGEGARPRPDGLPRESTPGRTVSAPRDRSSPEPAPAGPRRWRKRSPIFRSARRRLLRWPRRSSRVRRASSCATTRRGPSR